MRGASLPVDEVVEKLDDRGWVMKNDEYRDTVRISDDERRRLLDELDRRQTVASEDVGPDDNRRRYRRYTYRPGHISIAVVQPRGGTTFLSVSPRNISAGGVAFLHGGFLHTGSRCAMQLGSQGKETVTIAGEIVNCRHIEGLLHEVSVKFDRAIDPSVFVQIDESQDAAPSEQVPPQKEAG